MRFLIDLETIKLQPRRFEIISRGMYFDKHQVDVVIPQDTTETLTNITSFLNDNGIKYHNMVATTVYEPEDIFISHHLHSGPNFLHYQDYGVGYTIEKIRRLYSELQNEAS